jgi:uncharacterized membrane protein
MKSIIVALAAALSLSAAASTASADTITVHGVWDKIWAEKHGK